jgi:hypothetical protein
MKFHSPAVRKRSDGVWLVRCRDCEQGRAPVPIGIDIPVSTLRMAELLRHNHAGRPVITSQKSLASA